MEYKAATILANDTYCRTITMTYIETVRLILRDFHPNDLTDYHAQIYSDPDVTRYLPGGQPRPIERTKLVLDFSIEHGREHGFSLWAVINKTDNRFVGHCGLIYIHNAPEVEVAYAFGKTFWGQGIGTEAARASLRYGFETAGLNQIIALAVPENIASQRIMQKIGMRPQGLTERYYNTNLALYTLSQDEFTP
jgi:ribosomal-protein-alanine N-acetyltransferase